MIATGPAGLVRRWVELYTRGLPAELRERRRTEIDADLWSQLEAAALLGRPAQSVNTEILTRWMFGIPADISWRLEHRGEKAMSTSTQPRIASRGAVAHGLTTILAGTTLTAVYGLAVLWFAGRSSAGLEWTSPPVVFLVMLNEVGWIAFAVSLLAFAVRYQDRFRTAFVVAAAVGGLAAGLGALGAWQLQGFLPLFSAVVAWNLAAVRSIPRILAGAHIVAAVLSTGLTVTAVQGAAIGPGFLVSMVWPLTLIAIGAAIMRGEPALAPPPDQPAEPANEPAREPAPTG